MAPMSCDDAHNSEAKVKPAQQMMNSRFRPNRSDIQPIGAVMMAEATMYEVSTQLIWSSEADSEPCMYGSATFATVVSRACMMVALIAHTVSMVRRADGDRPEASRIIFH